MPYPALSIDGVHEKIGLPLCKSQAKLIVEKSSRSPFGRGEETIVDVNVRRTWQLDPRQVKIENREWSTSLDILLSRVKVELGCDATKNVTCEFYKLLLYEPGGFFKVS